MKNNEVDMLLIGGGIMSATLGVLLRQLNPNLRITMVEKLPAIALESSDAMNNAGTGLSPFFLPDRKSTCDE
jgi:malate dehydrogenase (quinone)